MVSLKKKVVSKVDIVTRVADETGYSQKMVATIVDTLLNDITAELSNGNKVQFAGFGFFEPKQMSERVGRNPRTNEQVTIPARVVPSFKPGNRLKEAVIRTEC